MQKSRARRVGALLVGLAIVGASACGGDDYAAEPAELERELRRSVPDALRFATPMQVRTPLPVSVADAIADRWVTVQSVRAVGFGFGGIPGEVVFGIANPTAALASLTIDDARVSADGNPLASGGRMAKTLLRAPASNATIRMTLAPIAGLAWLLRSTTDRVVPLCADIAARLEVGVATRRLNVAVCRTTSLLELAAAMSRAMMP